MPLILWYNRGEAEPTAKAARQVILDMQELPANLLAHPTVAEVVAKGYAIRYAFTGDGKQLHLRATPATNSTALAGHGLFRIDDPVGTIKVETIHVVKPHRRQHVANALYVAAKLLTGREFVPAKSQTDDGRGIPHEKWTLG